MNYLGPDTPISCPAIDELKKAITGETAMYVDARVAVLENVRQINRQLRHDNTHLHYGIAKIIDQLITGPATRPASEIAQMLNILIEKK